nr:hypothetical protein [Tanacetum cinerariifolium]
MMLCKQVSKGIPLSANQNEWLQDTDEEPDEQELIAHYMYTAKIQEVLNATDDNFRPTYDAESLEKVHTDDDYNVFATERQHFEQPESINDIYVVKRLIVMSFLIHQIIIHNTSDSRPQLRSTQMKDKVVPNNIQVMLKKKRV